MKKKMRMMATRPREGDVDGGVLLFIPIGGAAVGEGAVLERGESGDDGGEGVEEPGCAAEDHGDDDEDEDECGEDSLHGSGVRI